MATDTKELKKVRASMMNAIHDLPLLVARDENFFRDQGHDVEIITTPGSGQKNSDHQALRSNIFERTMDERIERIAFITLPTKRPATLSSPPATTSRFVLARRPSARLASWRSLPQSRTLLPARRVEVRANKNFNAHHTFAVD